MGIVPVNNSYKKRNPSSSFPNNKVNGGSNDKSKEYTSVKPEPIIKPLVYVRHSIRSHRSFMWAFVANGRKFTKERLSNELQTRLVDNSVILVGE